MNEGDAIDLVQSAIWMVVVGAGPCIGAAMAIGVVIFVAASLTASFVGAKFSIFTESVYARIEQGYK